MRNHFYTAHHINGTSSLGDKPEDWNPPIGKWMVKNGQLTWQGDGGRRPAHQRSSGRSPTDFKEKRYSVLWTYFYPAGLTASGYLSDPNYQRTAKREPSTGIPNSTCRGTRLSAGSTMAGHRDKHPEKAPRVLREEWVNLWLVSPPLAPVRTNLFLKVSAFL